MNRKKENKQEKNQLYLWFILKNKGLHFSSNEAEILSSSHLHLFAGYATSALLDPIHMMFLKLGSVSSQLSSTA